MKKPRPTPAECQPRKPPPHYGPITVEVDLTAEQHASLAQIHSVVNSSYDRKAWSVPDVLRACIAFTASYLSLPIPDSGTAATAPKEGGRTR